MQEHRTYFTLLSISQFGWYLSGFFFRSWSSSHFISRAFHFPTKFSFRSFQSLLCECNIVWKISRIYTPNKLVTSHKHTFHQMLIHYNTKILILWRHTPIQWKFIWQHFWTLEYCHIEHSFRLSLFFSLASYLH